MLYSLWHKSVSLELRDQSGNSFMDHLSLVAIIDEGDVDSVFNITSDSEWWVNPPENITLFMQPTRPSKDGDVVIPLGMGEVSVYVRRRGYTQYAINNWRSLPITPAIDKYMAEQVVPTVEMIKGLLGEAVRGEPRKVAELVVLLADIMKELGVGLSSHSQLHQEVIEPLTRLSRILKWEFVWVYDHDEWKDADEDDWERVADNVIARYRYRGDFPF